MKIIVSMAASVYKWLFLPLVAAGFLSGTPRPLHPFHVSVTEVNHNATDKTLEISCKIFTDDFEKILAKNFKTKVDLINPPNKAAMDSLVKNYILHHLSIKADGKQVNFAYVGFENESEAVYSYIEVENILSVKKLDISNNLMYDLFDDQMNIMHITVNGGRKSTRLSFPETKAEFSF